MKDENAGTSTSCMIVQNIEDTADAHSCKASDLFTMLKDRFGQETSSTQTCYVSSFISTRMVGKSHTFSSKAEELEYLIQLRCWKNSEIKDERPQDRYLQTYASVNMQAPEDSKMYKHVMQIILTGAEEFMARDGTHWEKN
jgi:hypothetical protein